MSDDDKLIKALRVLSERPDVLEAALALAKQDSGPKPTIKELWDNHYAPWGERHLSSWERVHRGHRRHLVGFFGDLVWTAVTHAKADEYVSMRLKQRTLTGNRQVKPGTVNRELATLKALLNQCLTGFPPGQRPITGSNPLDGYPSLPESTDRRFHLNEEDFVRLLEAARPMLREMLIFAFETGMRRDEFRLLDWSEVDMELAVIHLPAQRTKARRARDVPLSDIAQEIIKARRRQRARSRFVFLNTRGTGPLPRTTMHTWFVQAREAAGVNGPKDQAVWLHTLRKSFGTIQAMSGMPIYMLMDIMGHVSKDVHDEYTRMSPEYHASARRHMNAAHRDLKAGDAPEPRPSPLQKFLSDK